MKKIALMNVLVLIMSLIAACGGSAPAVTQAPATEAVQQPSITDAPAQPAQTDTPTTGDGSTQVDITLADNTIEASLTTFQAGVPYTFVITNAGRRAHNFNINPPVSVAGSLDAALDQALLVVEQNQLSAGANVTVEYTFPESAVGQQLEFSCLIRKHYDDEMYLAITVTK